MKAENDSEKFIKENTYLRGWVVECVICHHKGYRSDTPDPRKGEGGPIYRTLRRFFDELVVDQNGYCDQCRAALG